MINLDNSHLMMIEPKNQATHPIDDDLTAMAQKVFTSAKPTTRYRGWHRCICGANSDNADWELPNGQITNSLLVHYVRYHRNEIPQSEIDKLKQQVK